MRERRDLELTADLQLPVVPLLGVLGAILVVGGIVAYRGSARLGIRAGAAGAIAVGVAIWAFLLWITPVVVTRGG